MPKCKNCKQQFTPKYFLQKYCNDQDCIAEATKYAIAQRDKNFKKQCRKDKRDFAEKNKTYTQKLQEARKVFQKWIRLVRDKDRNCISCDKPAKDYDGGHYLKAELFSGLIFNEKNVHKQCVYCNHHKSGNELEYRDGLIKRYGIEYVESLESIKNENRERRYSDVELNEIKEKYKL